MSEDLLDTNALTWTPTDTDPRILQDMQRNIQHRNVQLHNDDPAHFNNRHPNNYEPYVHKELRSFATNRYTKEINTTVLIDSRDRDTTLYPLPNNFTIALGKQFEYLESIELTSVDIDNSTPPVHQYNNCIEWTYPRECDVDADSSLVPTIDNEDLPSTFFASEKVCYKACIPIGFYTVNELRKALMDYMNDVVHSMCDTGLADLGGQVHSFHVDINVNTHEVEFVNRINIQEPVIIQTFLTEDDDVLRPFGGTCPGDPEAFYLTIPDNGDKVWKGDSGGVGDLSQASLLPVVHTHLPTIGGIPEQLINYVEYWDRYISTGITEFPYYEFCDSITIGTKTFSRYKFYPRNSAGQEVMAAYSQTVLLSPSMAPFLNALVGNAANYANPFTTLNTSNLLNNESDVSNYLIPQGGCALPFKFKVVPDPPATNCDFNAVCSPRTISILELLGWPTEDSANGFGFIQDNEGSDGQTPSQLITWERNSVGDYVLRSEPYILMKLIVPGHTDDVTGDNLVKSRSLNVQDSNNNVGFFTEPKRNFNDRDVRNLFAKIRLNATQPNRSLFFSTSVLKFYDRPLRQLNEFTVQLVDRHGQLANIRGDWNFTMEIVELQDQLSEANIDTRNGSHSLTGIRDINHHY